MCIRDRAHRARVVGARGTRAAARPHRHQGRAGTPGARLRERAGEQRDRGSRLQPAQEARSRAGRDRARHGLSRRRPRMRLSSSSIGGRLARSLVLWAVLWCAALGAAVWVIVQEEVDEPLDDSLQPAAEGLIGPLALGLTEPVEPSTLARAPKTSGRFTWQLVGHQGRTQLAASARGAPVAPLHDTPKPGFSDVPGWRVYGQATGRDGQMLYVAQTTEERAEAGTRIALAALFAGAPMTLIAVLWLRSRIRSELEPLADLSQRLAHYDPMQPGATLGAAEREELRPVHAATDALAGRPEGRAGLHRVV